MKPKKPKDELTKYVVVYSRTDNNRVYHYSYSAKEMWDYVKFFDNKKSYRVYKMTSKRIKGRKSTR